MKLSLLLFSSVALAFLAPDEKRWGNFQTKHVWSETPRGWINYDGNVAQEYNMKMRIGLKQSRFDDLVEQLLRVSNPRHSRYGNHLSRAAVNELIAPRPRSSQLVEAWLSHHGVRTESIRKSEVGDWLSVSIPLSLAEKMLDAKYRVFYHPQADRYIVRTLSYSLPVDLHDHVEVISPTTNFGQMRPMRSTINVLSSSDSPTEISNDCNSTITPTCLKELYNMQYYTPQSTDNNKFGITGYISQYASYSDLQQFLKEFMPDAVGQNFTLEEVNGGLNNQSEAGLEANLDIQYTEALTQPTRNIFYSTGGDPPFMPDSSTEQNTNEAYLDWLDYILSLTDDELPQTISTSYGDDEQTVPLDYATSVCNGFAQLGARGVSVLFSSGDSGVGSSGNCFSNDGQNRSEFLPVFPASCPWVTAVGATRYIKPEVGANFSGGGFSNYFGRPSYQADAVSSYLSNLGDDLRGWYNSSGRAYPDVSAQGYNFQTVQNGSLEKVWGTSASAPTFASVIALLNDYRIASNKSSLGFLNIWLYQDGQHALNDITSGSNPGCDTSGFSASDGWDPVTGLGTPNFQGLQNNLLDKVSDSESGSSRLYFTSNLNINVLCILLSSFVFLYK